MSHSRNVKITDDNPRVEARGLEVCVTYPTSSCEKPVHCEGAGPTGVDIVGTASVHTASKTQVLLDCHIFVEDTFDGSFAPNVLIQHQSVLKHMFLPLVSFSVVGTHSSSLSAVRILHADVPSEVRTPAVSIGMTSQGSRQSMPITTCMHWL